MTITELSQPGGLEKLKTIRLEKGAHKLRSQVRKLQSINKNNKQTK